MATTTSRPMIWRFRWASALSSPVRRVGVVAQQGGMAVGGEDEPGVVPVFRGVFQRDRRGHADQRMRGGDEQRLFGVEVDRAALDEDFVRQGGPASPEIVAQVRQ